jgi:hypothetical protein
VHKARTNGPIHNITTSRRQFIARGAETPVAPICGPALAAAASETGYSSAADDVVVCVGEVCGDFETGCRAADAEMSCGYGGGAESSGCRSDYGGVE